MVAASAPEGGSFSVRVSSSRGGIPRPVWVNGFLGGGWFQVYHLDTVRRIHRMEFVGGGWFTPTNDLWDSGQEFAGHPSPMVAKTPH